MVCCVRQLLDACEALFCFCLLLSSIVLREGRGRSSDSSFQVQWAVEGKTGDFEGERERERARALGEMGM